MDVPQPPAIALSLATKFVPSLIGALKGDNAEKVAQDVVGIAQSITGQQDPDQAAIALSADLALAAAFKEKVLEYQVEIYKEGTKRLEIVNQTMRSELAIGENVQNFKQFILAFWKSGWRPYWGFISGTAFGIQIFGIMAICGYSVWKQPQNAVVIINALAALVGALMATWALALTVLGVSVLQRSKDKQLASGDQKPGLLEGAIKAFKGIS